MGYAIEMTQMATNTDSMRSHAISFNCETQYFMNDDPVKKRVDCVHVVIFSDDNFHNLLRYIRKIKRDKMAHIECIYYDDISCNLLYASSRYLRKTNKEFDGTGKDDVLSSIFPGTTEEDDDSNLLRMAERKKIRKMDDVDSNEGHYHQVTGSELSSVGVIEIVAPNMICYSP